MKLNASVVLTIFCLLATQCSGEIATQSDDDFVDYNAYRLPDNTEPVSYELRLEPTIDPDNKEYTFSGQIDILIKANRYASEVVLNSKNLNVLSVSALTDVKINRSIAVSGHKHDDVTEQLVIKLERKILPSRLYKFMVSFEGILRDDFTGFHKYFYDSNNRSRWIALTQFKPIFARRAFPCFDEPRYKTPYKISIARPVDHYSLSNMPVSRSEIYLRSGLVWDHFETTKPIPTYLVAFMISDFDKMESKNESIAMYTRKEYINNTVYMMEKAPTLLGGVEKFTQIPYMLPKLDLVGVPLLDAYNMENWGLNSYKEFYLTLSSNSQMEDEVLGSMTVLHEFIHQWFGNMVTTPRWDYAWLNEGICNYLKYFIMDTIEPMWDLQEKFIENVHQRALAWDEYEDTHSLTFPVSTPDDIVNSFDAVTSDKSAALFRMLKYMVGETNFKLSLNKYLNDFAYSKAGPKELWETFDYLLYDTDVEDEVTVNETMYLWTEQPGYPLVNVMTSDNGSIVITQERFLLKKSSISRNMKWFIGLTYTTENERNFDNVVPTVWLKPTETRTIIPVPADSGWMVFNIQSTGFYRVNYEEKNWKLLLIQLITNPDKIHFLNRAQIIDDAHHLSKAALLPYDYYISLLEYLLMEDHITPWNTAIEGLSSIMNGMRRYPTEHLKLKEYVRHFADVLYKKLSLNQIKNKSTKTGWGKLFTWSCKMGSLKCEESAMTNFDAWLTGYEIPSEMKEASFCVGMKKYNFTVWSKVFEFVKTTRSVSHREIALRALACIDNAQVLFNYLNRILFDDLNHVSIHSFKTICKSIATSSQGVKALASFLSRKLEAILELDDGHQFASSAYSVLTPKVTTDEEVAYMNKIRLSIGLADLRSMFEKKHQTITSNIMWMERDHLQIINAIGK